MNQRWIGV